MELLAAGRRLDHSSVQTVESTCAAHSTSWLAEMIHQLVPCSQTDHALLKYMQVYHTIQMLWQFITY